MQSSESQLASKDREWRDLLSATVGQLKKVQDERNFYRTCYEQLREDFLFNLAVLDERDRELARYDRLTAKALTVNPNRHKEHGHTYVQVREDEAIHDKEKKKGICNSHYRLHLNKIACCMTDEAHKLTVDHEGVKCDLENKIHEVERLFMQRQEMTAFQKELRDHVNHMDTLLSSQDGKVKRLYEETKVCSQTLLQTTQDLNFLKHFCDSIQIQLQQKEQQMENVFSVNNSRIKDLEDKLTMKEMKMKEGEEKYIKKYQDMVHALKQAELQQNTHYRAQSHRLQKAEKYISKLQRNMEALHDTIKKKEKALHWRDGYEEQLSASLEREENLEKMRAQMELEWRRCCENTKTEHRVNEQLIKGLAENKNQTKEKVERKELQDLTVKPSTTVRDQAVQCLNPTEDPEKIGSLQQRNAELQAMVSQMRKDMEALSAQSQVQSQAFLPRMTYNGLPAQISTHLIPQSGGIHHEICQPNVSKSAPLHKQGGMWPEQKDNSVDLIPSVDSEKLHKEKLLLRQQHSSGIISDDIFKYAQGRPVQRVRLKRAALCITRLMKEKQHLIEMCNRLRGVMSSSGFKEKLHEQHDGVTNVEQHQLTSQEQQCRGRDFHLTEQEATAKEVTENPPFQETDRPEVSKSPITQSEVRQTHSSVGEPNLYQSIESLQSLWDLLDYGLSSSLSEEAEVEQNKTEPVEPGVADDQMMVCGITAPVHNQPPNKLLQKRHFCTAKKTTGTLKPRPKIRN